MSDHQSTATPPTPHDNSPGAAPPPSPPSTGGAFHSTDTPPTGSDVPGSDSIAPAPVSDEALADRAAEDVFGSEENARHTAGLIKSFVSSWERHKHEKAPRVWLADEFRRYPDLWSGEEEIVSTAEEVVYAIEQANADKASLHAHLDAGKSKASWLAGKIEQGAAAAGVVNVGNYAGKIDGVLIEANERMLNTIERYDKKTERYVVNMNRNLDGFIAEQHHADTFNLHAATKGSPLRAEVLGSQGKNSVDIVIKDGDGNIIKRYQSKYGHDANATQEYFEKGQYPGQGKLVPSGQESDVANSTGVIEADGVRSEPLTKDEAKRLQEQAQQEREIRRYEWNDVNRIEIAKSIGKQALVGAAITCGFQGTRILGRRVWNFLRGEENPPASEDLREFFESSVKSARHVVAQVAVSGAVVVAARNGWIKVLKYTPAGIIANIVHVGMENAKVLFKLAKGELNGTEALDAMGNTTVSAYSGLKVAGMGLMKGVELGAVMGPVGAVLGGFVGSLVGYCAGSKIGEAVYEGGKAIVKTVAKAVTSVAEGAVEAVKSVGRWVMGLIA